MSECMFKGRPKHVYPCSNCKEDCNNPNKAIPMTCYDCRYKHEKDGRNGCKRGLRPCKDFVPW